MNTLSMIGANIVILAMVFYSIAIITEQRKRLVTPFVLRFLVPGLVCDITATAFMIAGSSHGPFTLHGILGYSSLAAMMVDTVLLLRFYRKQGSTMPTPTSLHLYSRYAYAWWIVAFVTGIMLVVFR